MPFIKPLSVLRHHADQLSQLCHDSGEPIFLTRNGRGDMVLMSVAAYDQSATPSAACSVKDT